MYPLVSPLCKQGAAIKDARTLGREGVSNDAEKMNRGREEV